ncbi:MAG: MBL fold metallo-hydrolase [Spirochaetaceae bacterium]|nr:MBL fold metallo-hydrolase [Spirochaetaceae bacterium]
MKFSIEWLGGATLRIKLKETTLMVDPILSPKGKVFAFRGFDSTRTDESKFNAEDMKEISIFLLTHGHEDHLDKPALESLPRDSFYIHHGSMRKILRSRGLKSRKALRPGKSWSQDWEDHRITVTAVPTRHCANRAMSPLVQGGNGYILHLWEGELDYRIYISGDSLMTAAQLKWIDKVKPQLIILNAGAAYPGTKKLARMTGRLTCNKKDIQYLAEKYPNTRILPVHWGAFSHYREQYDEMNFMRVENVRLLEPGEIWEIEKTQRQNTQYPPEI